MGAAALGCECTTYGLDADTEVAAASVTGDASEAGDPGPTTPTTSGAHESSTTGEVGSEAGMNTTEEDATTSVGDTTGAACLFSAADQRHALAATGSPYVVTCATGLLSSPPDGDGCGVEASVVEAPEKTLRGGDVAVNPDGSFTFERASGFFGCDGFRFAAEDPRMCSDDATTLLTVAPAVDGVLLDSEVALTDRGFRVAGSTVRMGENLASVGDVDGDGFDDFIVGEGSYAADGGKENPNALRVLLFGGVKPPAQEVVVNANMQVAGAEGVAFKLSTWNYHGPTVGIGDFNGDGYGDFALGRWVSSNGTTYIVLGRERESLATLNFENGTPKGVWPLYTPLLDDSAGAVLTAAGDVNGDGLDDLLIGSVPKYVNMPNNFPDYYAYLVFGRTDLENHGTIESLALAADTVTDEYVAFKRELGRDWTGTIAGLGDFNGDGFDDLFLGNHVHEKAHIYLGRAAWSANPIDLDAMAPTDGFTFTYKPTGSGPLIVATGADMNGDGYNDVVIGHSAASSGIETARGAAYVIWGGATPPAGTVPLLLNEIEDGSKEGVFLKGRYKGDGLGASVSASGDVDADGLDDVVLGGPAATGGHGYVLFGQSADAWANTPMAQALQQGLAVAFQGERMSDYTGAVVSGGGDFNGDGFADLLIGQPEAGFGHVMAVFGGCFTGLGEKVLTVGGLFERKTLIGTDVAERLVGGVEDNMIVGGEGDVLYGGGGDDTITVTHAGFARVDGGGSKDGDTLRIEGVDLTIDHRVQGIEKIELGEGSSVELGHRALRKISRTDNTLTIAGSGTANIDLTGHDFEAATDGEHCVWTDGILTLRVHQNVEVVLEGVLPCK